MPDKKPLSAIEPTQAPRGDADRDVASSATTAPAPAGLEPPISPPLSESETDPAWVQLLTLFQRYNHPEPPVHLRDELVTFMAWAWYGQKTQAALTALRVERERYKEMYVTKSNEKVAEFRRKVAEFRRAEAAEARVAELEKALDDRRELRLTITADTIARVIETHDLFDVPDGTTYVKASKAIADDIVAALQEDEGGNG